MSASERLRELSARAADPADPTRDDYWAAFTLFRALPLIVDALEAAERMHEWLYNERTSSEPPSALLDKGFVSMIDSDTYERDEQEDDKLAVALTALCDALPPLQESGTATAQGRRWLQTPEGTWGTLPGSKAPTAQ